MEDEAGQQRRRKALPSARLASGAPNCGHLSSHIPLSFSSLPLHRRAVSGCKFPKTLLIPSGPTPSLVIVTNANGAQ